MQDNTSLESIEEKINELSQHVPFGHSAFQIVHMANGKDGDYRRLRHHLLAAKEKLSALKKAQFDRQRLMLDLEELLELAEKADSPDSIFYRRTQIDIDEKTWMIKEQEKFIVDAIIELDIHHRIISQLPEIKSRNEFESNEKEYWSKRLVREASQSMRANGTIPSGHLEILDDFCIFLNRSEDGITLEHKENKLLKSENGE